MTYLASELQTVLLTRLRECEVFSNGVAGRIADRERDDYPFAWVAVTQSEVRYDDNHEAQHGIARFSAEIVDSTS